MQDWIRDRQQSYLETVISSQGRTSNHCSTCRSSDTAVWRCLDCIGGGELCRECCKSAHTHNPFHRIEKWNGTFFQPSWLWRVGAIICMGHSGGLCPGYNQTREELERRCLEFNNLDGKDTDLSDDPTFGSTPSVKQLGSGKVVLVVHTNGFHHLPTFPCLCNGAKPIDLQFLALGLYPASSADVSTVFTLPVLKHFHLMKVDAHLSTEIYSTILQRLTNYVFPSETPVCDIHYRPTWTDILFVQDRKRELARIWQQWNHLTNLKRNGFGHGSQGRIPSKGEFALFCLVCPQVGINLPPDWRNRGPL
jgi:hypothetical protein